MTERLLDLKRFVKEESGVEVDLLKFVRSLKGLRLSSCLKGQVGINDAEEDI